MKLKLLLGLLLFALLIYFHKTVSNILYLQGCVSGFINADFPINFSSVQVKRYTNEGELKSQTTCAPRNGFYLIPIYDTEDYVIKVESPESLYFQPNVSAIKFNNIDGVWNVYNPFIEINYYCKGFSVKGKVVRRGSKDGPAGVKIFLYSETDLKKPIRESLSLENGAYEFGSVLPGNYVITGSHPDLVFETNNINIRVEKATRVVENNLVVAGNDLKGCVIGDDGEAVYGVHFILFGKSVVADSTAALMPRQCVRGLPKAYNYTKSSGPFKTKLFSPLCYVTSSKDGCFKFAAVVPGVYVVVPFYRIQSIKFDVVPSSFSLKMGHSAFDIQPGFKVDGLSVSEPVLTTSMEGKRFQDSILSPFQVLVLMLVIYIIFRWFYPANRRQENAEVSRKNIMVVMIVNIWKVSIRNPLPGVGASVERYS